MGKEEAPVETAAATKLETALAEANSKISSLETERDLAVMARDEALAAKTETEKHLEKTEERLERMNAEASDFIRKQQDSFDKQLHRAQNRGGEATDDALVPMHKDGNAIHAHPHVVDEHKKNGWKVA